MPGSRRRLLNALNAPSALNANVERARNCAVKAIGTNVLLRLFVNDDKAQAAKARALIEAHAAEDHSLWIADVVLVELVWALTRS